MKKILYYFLLMLASFSAWGQVVSSREAAIISLNFIQNSTGTNSRISSITPLYKDTTICLYKIRHENNKWCIIPSSMEFPPIIAYGWSDIEDEPEAFESLIESYKEIIYSAIKSNHRSRNVNEAWSHLLNPERHNQYIYAVGDSLLDMTGKGDNLWKQGYNNSNQCNPSYNMHCPTSNSDNCRCGHKLVGCGAVAMGQIMWYWQWPKSSEYRTYHWENMPGKIISSTPYIEADEVANLLHDCGLASGMSYHCSYSYTVSDSIIKAFKDCFNYKNVIKHYANDWTYQNSWRDLISSEIDNGRPVCFYGDGGIFFSGHFFVLDGYLDWGPFRLFHVNWGHGYGSNCFCLLDRLTEGEDDFSRHNRAIVGISPTYNESSITNLNYTTLPSGQKRNEYAYNQITVPSTGNSLTIESGASFTLESGNEIILQDGFEARRGSSLDVHINTAWQSQMAISVPEWPMFTGPDGYCIYPKNADSWEFTLMNRQYDILYQSAGSIRTEEVCLWDGQGVSAGSYFGIITLKNSYGRKLHQEIAITVTNRLNSQDSNENSTDTILSKKAYHTKTTTSSYNTQSLCVTPNPSNDVFNISVTTDTIIGICVYNTYGHQVYSDDNILQSTYRLNLLAFPQGNYIVEAHCKHGKYSAKIIKQ